MDSFFPKCYDLTDGLETEDFKQEFRFLKVIDFSYKNFT